MKIKEYILFLLLAISMIGCEQPNEPSQSVKLPISICLPMNEVHSANAPRRVMGDPGTKEDFLFPHHLYYIVMKKDGESTWTLWAQEHRTLNDEDWIAEPYTGILPTPSDSIYRYKEEINLPLATATFGERHEFLGRVYAIASAEALTFNQALNTIESMSDLLNLAFSTSSATIQQNLKHIYSTPYNLTDDGEYFGAFSSIAQRVPHVSLLLYHVAAKVDITWKTASSDLRLTNMKACNLFRGNAYCFKPMENSSGATPYVPAAGQGDTITIIGSNAVGQWWEGRYYFYTIPYTTTGKAGYFPLQMEMSTNESSAKYRPTVYMQVNTTDPFVPWLRANFNIKEPLIEKTEDKIIDL